jgi:hypothetical protein
MKRVLVTALSALAVIVAALLIFATTKPDSFSVQRMATIKAPAEKIVAHINDFHSWNAWSPYENRDPAMKRSYSGEANGKGATYAWEGNSDVGAGHMEITEASLSKVTIKLDFLKPFEAHNTAEFTLEPEGESTRVTWAMRGPSPFISKVMSIFFNMDKMIGKDFEAGLANLKTLAER